MVNLFNLFTQKVDIAGLEISDAFIRVALLGVDKKNKAQPYIIAVAEEELSPGVVVQGIIHDKPGLIKSLQSLMKKAGITTRYVVLSISTDSVYSKVFDFPRNIQGEKLEETMKLTVGFQLPLKPEEVHLDWEKVGPIDGDLNQIYLAAIPNSVTNSYVEVLQAAKLSPIAIETHPLSLLRSIDHKPEESFLLQMPGPSSIGIHVFKNNILHFSRTIPSAHIPQGSLSTEVTKIQNAYEADHGPIGSLVSLDKLPLKNEFMAHPVVQQNPSAWLVSLGAAERGLLDRSVDTLISLMPVGTEQAYQYQKAITFIEFVSNLTIGLSIFFVVAFIGVMLFMNSLQQRSNEQLSHLNTEQASEGSVELEERADATNLLLQNLSDISGTFPRWSPVTEEMRLRIIPGILVTSASITNPEAPLTINGTAKTRAILNDFKKKLSESTLFTEVNIPLNYLDQRENIPFTASFKLKDPDLVYTQ